MSLRAAALSFSDSAVIRYVVVVVLWMTSFFQVMGRNYSHNYNINSNQILLTDKDQHSPEISVN